MAWSTREVAELAGTTVRAVRHYHEVGLLEEPRRRANGYKQYGVAHLIRTLRIKRLSDLGFSLPQIADMGDADRHPRQALQVLDNELGQTLEHLQRVRVEVGEILVHASPIDLPPELAEALSAVDLSDADRSLLVVMSRVLEPALVMAFVELLQTLPASAAACAFDELAADADEPTRQDLAERLLPHTLAIQALLPGAIFSSGTASAAYRTLDQAVNDLYNPAQLDVLRRVRRLRAASRPVRNHPPKAGGLSPAAAINANSQTYPGTRDAGNRVRLQTVPAHTG